MSSGPKVKRKWLWISSVGKNIQCLILLGLVVYTPTQYALPCKIPKFKIYVNRKKSKYYLGNPMLKQNGSEYNLSEKIYNALLYSVL